jgi:hypothetical protein
MVIGGFWHGAAWTFVIWGLFHGLCLWINNLWQEFRPPIRLSIPFLPWLTRWAGTVLTLFLVAVGWVFFRAASLKAAGLTLVAMSGLGTGPAVGTPALIHSRHWILLATLLAFVWLLPNVAQLVRDWQAYPAVTNNDWSSPHPWQRWRMTRTWACVTALLLAVAILSLSHSGEFLYYNF